MVHVKKTLTGICLSFAMVTPIMAQTSVQEQAKTQEQAVNYSQKVKNISGILELNILLQCTLTIFLRFQVAINHTLVMEEC